MSEAERLAALHRYQVPYTGPERQFDRIVELAAKIFSAPMATISVLDAERVWFKARYGLDFAEAPRAQAFSTSAVESGQVVIIRDATTDERFRKHPHVVGEPGIRFIAAAPFFSPDGYPVGAVCVLDRHPRPDLPIDRVAALEALARLVEAEFERGILSTHLNETADRFRGLAEVSSEWVWQTDAEHRFSGLFSDYSHMNSIVPEGFSGRRRWDFKDARPLVGTWQDHIALVETHKEFRGFEYEVKTDAGEYHVLCANGRPRFDAHGNFLGYRGTGSDITDQRRAEQHLARSETNFRYLFEKHPNSMWVFSQEDYRFLTVNEAACTTYGYTADEFRALTLFDIRPAEDIGPLEKHLAGVDWSHRHIRTGRHRTRSGVLMDVVVEAVAIEFDGRPARLAMIRDVTEELRTQARLAQADAIARRSEKLEAIGQLTGVMAHDFNNILMIMMLKVEGAADELPPDSPAQTRLAAALAAGARGADLVSRLMTFARRRPLELKNIDVRSLLDDISGLVRTAISNRVTLSLTVGNELPPCCIDRNALEIAIINLAVNARDAMPDGGELRISAHRRLIADTEALARPDLKAGDWIEISVTDTGCGMPADVQAKVFELFFTTKSDGKGTGLGLAMVYGFAEQSGGFLTLTSAVGQGTTISIFLPAVAEIGAPTAPV
jgi:PAS domain S-box-containing protein